jgi:nicotinic acid phosphoribosyltransferase
MNPAQRQTAKGILFSDAYQLSMAHLYFHMGLHEKLAQFDHFFGSYSSCDTHESGSCINAGLKRLLDWLRTARFGDEDIIFPQRQENPDHFHITVKHLIHPHFYHVSLTERLRQLKQSLIASARRAFS